MKKDGFDLEAIGQRMKKVRACLHKTQADMAAALGVSLSHYSKLEVGIGGMSHGLIYTFCRLFNVSEEWFLNGVGDEPQNCIDPTDLAKQPQHATMMIDLDTDLEKIFDFALSDKVSNLANQIATATSTTKARALAMLVKELLINPEKNAENK